MKRTMQESLGSYIESIVLKCDQLRRSASDSHLCADALDKVRIELSIIADAEMETSNEEHSAFVRRLRTALHSSTKSLDDAADIRELDLEDAILRLGERAANGVRVIE